MQSQPVPAPAPASKTDADARKLLLSCDYGTKTLAMAYRITSPGEEAHVTKVHDVKFDRKTSAPQQVAWGPDGTFYWGYGVDKALQAKLIQSESVVEQFKLLLYKDHATSDIAERVTEQLRRAGRTLHDLLTEHLRAILQDARKFMKGTQAIYQFKDEVRACRALGLDVY